MAVDDVYKLTVSAQSQNQLYQNTLYVRLKTEVSPIGGDFQTIVDAFKNLWQPAQHQSVTWTTWQAVQQAGSGITTIASECRRTGGLQFGGVLTAPLSGAQNAYEALPPQCAMVSTILTGFTGRRKRGRWYGFGLTENDQSGGLWSGTVTTGVATRLNSFFSTYGVGGSATGHTLGVWSERTATGCEHVPGGPKHNLVEQPHPELAFTPATVYALRSVVFTQRRRTLGVGR